MKQNLSLGYESYVEDSNGSILLVSRDLLAKTLSPTCVLVLKEGRDAAYVLRL